MGETTLICPNFTVHAFRCLFAPTTHHQPAEQKILPPYDVATLTVDRLLQSTFDFLIRNNNDVKHGCLSRVSAFTVLNLFFFQTQRKTLHNDKATDMVDVFVPQKHEYVYIYIYIYIYILIM